MKLIINAALFCPFCGARHIDETRNGEKWDRRAHTTHRCQTCKQDFDVYVNGAPEPQPVMPPTLREKMEALVRDMRLAGSFQTSITHLETDIAYLKSKNRDQ